MTTRELPLLLSRFPVFVSSSCTRTRTQTRPYSTHTLHTLPYLLLVLALVSRISHNRTLALPTFCSSAPLYPCAEPNQTKPNQIKSTTNKAPASASSAPCTLIRLVTDKNEWLNQLHSTTHPLAKRLLRTRTQLDHKLLFQLVHLNARERLWCTTFTLLPTWLWLLRCIVCRVFSVRPDEVG